MASLSLGTSGKLIGKACEIGNAAFEVNDDVKATIDTLEGILDMSTVPDKSARTPRLVRHICAIDQNQLRVGLKKEELDEMCVNAVENG